MQSVREFKAAYEIVHFKSYRLQFATLLSFNICKIFKTRYGVPETDLGLHQILVWISDIS